MLDKSQKQIVEEFESPVLVSLNFGCGRITLIVEKIKFLARKGVSLNSIVVFVKSLSSEREILRRLCEEDLGEVRVFEIGRFCKSFVRKNFGHFKFLNEYQKKFFFYDYVSQNDFRSSNKKHDKGNFSEDLYSSISYLQKFKTIDELSLENFTSRLSKLDIIYAMASYNNFKKENNFLDSEDCLFSALRILKEREKEFCEFEHVFYS